MLKGCRKLFKGFLAFLVVASTSVKGNWFAGFLSSGEKVEVEAGGKTYKILLNNILQEQDITSQIVEAGLPKMNDNVRLKIIFQLICSGKAPVVLKNYFLKSSVLAKAAEMGAIDASLGEAFMDEMTRGCPDELKKQIVVRICEAVTPFESMRAFAEELLPELNNDLTLGELCDVDVELIKALWQDYEIPEEVLNLVGRSSFFGLATLLTSFGKGVGNVAHENIREANSLLEQFCNGSLGCWLTKGECGDKLKTICDKLFKEKGIYSLARYSIKFATEGTIPSCCEINDKAFTFSSKKIVLKSKEPYIEIDRFITLPETSKGLLGIQYCGKVDKAFYIEDSENFYPIDLLSDFAAIRQQIEAVRGPLSKELVLSGDVNSIVCWSGGALPWNGKRFLPANRALKTQKHLVVQTHFGEIKVITRVFFYSSELYTGQAFKKFNEEETEAQDKLFDDLMAKAQCHLNNNASAYTEDEQKIIGQNFKGIMQSYQKTHVLPAEAMAFAVNENLEGFVASLIRNSTGDKELFSDLYRITYPEEVEELRKQEAEEEAKRKAAEEKRIAEEQEKVRLAEEERKAEELRKQQEEEARIKAEAERKAKAEAEAEEKLRKEAEEKRIAEEQEKARLAEEERKAEELRKQQGFTMKEIVAKAQSVSTPLRRNTISRLIRAGKIKPDETPVNSKGQLHSILFDSFDMLNSGK